MRDDRNYTDGAGVFKLQELARINVLGLVKTLQVQASRFAVMEWHGFQTPRYRTAASCVRSLWVARNKVFLIVPSLVFRMPATVRSLKP